MLRKVRPPAAAGRFYPADPGRLTAMVDAMLAAAPTRRVEGRIVGALCPHAGYEFSGPPTAAVCKALAAAKPEVVAIVGTAHSSRREGFFLDGHGALRTPLGEVPVAGKEAAALLAAGARVEASAEAHSQEHSVEVVLPFLQRALGKFELIPLVSNSSDLKETVRFGQALAGVLKGRRAVVVAASDLSHYPSRDVARRADPASLASFLTLDPAYLWLTEEYLMRQGAPELHCTWCGKAAAAAAQAAAAALGADWGEEVSCTNSADRGGDAEKTVGYGAALLLEKGSRRPWPTERMSPQDKSGLLNLARDSVQAHLRREPLAPRLFEPPLWNLPGAVFVTWTTRAGDLRGCIGTTEPQDTLGNAVARYAVVSAAEDHRFPPVTEAELSALRAEVSILSAPQRARPEDVRPGLGVLVRRGARSGLFLPQVWEKLPELESFMSYLCREKAGLPADAWRQPGTELSVFSVAAFAED